MLLRRFLRAESFDGSSIFVDRAIVYDSAAHINSFEKEFSNLVFPSLGGIIYSFWTVPTELPSINFSRQLPILEQDKLNATLEILTSVVSKFSSAECVSSPNGLGCCPTPTPAKLFSPLKDSSTLHRIQPMENAQKSKVHPISTGPAESRLFGRSASHFSFEPALAANYRFSTAASVFDTSVATLPRADFAHPQQQYSDKQEHYIPRPVLVPERKQVQLRSTALENQYSITQQARLHGMQQWQQASPQPIETKRHQLPLYKERIHRAQERRKNSSLVDRMNVPFLRQRPIGFSGQQSF